MIDYKEVRIGNLVMYEGQEYKIEGISKDYPFLDTIEFGAKVVEWEDLEPIPLTEDWLLKFGFNTIEDGWYNREYSPISFTWNIYDRHVRSVGYVFKHIQYVHQLQNLFSCLCGKELKIQNL